MALSTFILDSRASKRLVKQTAVGTTANSDVIGKAATIFGIVIKNTQGGAATAFIKLYNAKSATSATTPTMNLQVNAGQTLGVHFPDGLSFATGLTLRAAQQQDESGASTAPATNIEVVILTD